MKKNEKQARRKEILIQDNKNLKEITMDHNGSLAQYTRDYLSIKNNIDVPNIDVNCRSKI